MFVFHIKNCIFLGSFGDNELSPECLDGAQRFLKKDGISIPQSYTSYLAPLQSTKIYNEIRTNRPHDKTLETVYETPYIVHLVNYYQIAQSKVVSFLLLFGLCNQQHFSSLYLNLNTQTGRKGRTMNDLKD